MGVNNVQVEGLFVGSNGTSNAFSGNHAEAFNKPNESVFCGAFGASQGVALLQKASRNKAKALQIAQILSWPTSGDEHKTTGNRRVSAVYLHDTSPSSRFVVAGDSMGHVTLWKWLLDSSSSPTSSCGDGKWRVVPSKPRSDLSGGVSCLKALETRRFGWVFLACFTDGRVGVFQEARRDATNEATHLKILCELSLGPKNLMETIDAVEWTASQDQEETVLIALGGVDMRVHVYELAHSANGETSPEPPKPKLHPLFAMEGHRGWIRCVAFQQADQTNQGVRLASCAQDQKIRIWRLIRSQSSEEHEQEDQASSHGFQEAGSVTKSMTGRWTLSCKFDSLLVGHEDWVTWIEWKHPDLLVSCSMDNTMMLWRKAASTGPWNASARIGELGGNGLLSCTTVAASSAAVGASDHAEFELLALNFSGQIDRWKQVDSNGQFLPALSVTGHCSQVTDLCWSPRGDYLLSVSLDQTARILASSPQTQSWHEIARSQVHGYDINCACFVHNVNAAHEDRYVCGADEKILRVFRAPDDFTRLAKHMHGEAQDESTRYGVHYAYAPELSLTNKLVAGGLDKTEPATAEESNASRDHDLLGGTDLNLKLHLPVGETLARKTLWPEMKKLYGHGNELLCVASSWAGDLIASACKSREEQFASVWLWDTTSLKPKQEPLMGHKSSAVQLAFAPNDQLLASVSKDRQLCIYGRDADDKFTLVFRSKAHKRIIWSCSWSPDSNLIMTGSRDQTFALWGVNKSTNTWNQLGAAIAAGQSVTAVAFAPVLVHDKYLAAVGLENGTISLFSVGETKSNWLVDKIMEFDNDVCSGGAITRLAWNHQRCELDSLQLAVSSLDHSVRIFKVQVDHPVQ